MKTRIELLRDVVARRQAQVVRIDGRKVYLDLFTASMLLQIHDALSPGRQAQFAALPWQRMLTIGWQLASGHRA